MRVLLLLLLVGCQPGYGGYYPRHQHRGGLRPSWIQGLGDPQHGRIRMNHYGLGAHANQYGEEVRIVGGASASASARSR